MPETVVFYSRSDLPRDWRDAFANAMPDVAFEVLTGPMPDPERASYAIVWYPPHGELARMTRLKAIFSLGAGVDHVLSDPAFPRHVPLSRVVDPVLTQGMTEYVCQHVLFHHRQGFHYAHAQAARAWRPVKPRLAGEVTVGILGLGVLGLDAARRLQSFGYRLRGWSATRKHETGIESFAGLEELDAFLQGTDVLVCLLPLTPDTRGILNAERFGQLPKNAAFINAARGGHVVEADLLAALDSGHLSGATLDVFAIEPLPADSRFWVHPRVVVTPHVASLTDAASAARRMADSIRRVRQGLPPHDLVDLARGY